MSATSPKLAVDDIADLRAYERERHSFRARIIELKRARRVRVGPIITLVFENRDTMRFQIQEMARAEKILSDDAIRHEVEIYNALIPEPGELSATLFLELTSKDELAVWLPKLVGIERAARIVLGDGGARAVVTAAPEASHAAQLTRPDVTASVHYVRFVFTSAQIERFAAEPAAIAIDHPHYAEATPLSDATKAALLGDLRGV